MTIYKYEAKNNDGVKIRGELECSDQEALSINLRGKGYFLIKYNSKNIRSLEDIFTKVSKIELAILCRQLSIVFSCSMNISEAMELLSKQSRNLLLKKSLLAIKEEIEKGQCIGSSFKKYNTVYPEIMINMITIGEESGNLEKIFLFLSNYFEREEKIIGKIKAAMAYPILLSLVTIGIVMFLMLKIVPTFAVSLASIGGKLPGLTVFVLNISNFMKNDFMYLNLCFVICIVVVNSLLKKDKINKLKDKIFIKIPLIKRLYISFIELRFTISMGILLESGITVFKAIQFSALCTNNIIIKNQFKLSIDEIMKGKSTLDALKQIQIFEPLIISMISIGEETGTLPEMFNKASEIIEDDLKRQISKVTALLEPVMIIMLSFIVGIIVYAVMMPVMNIMDNIAM